MHTLNSVNISEDDVRYDITFSKLTLLVEIILAVIIEVIWISLSSDFSFLILLLNLVILVISVLISIATWKLSNWIINRYIVKQLSQQNGLNLGVRFFRFMGFDFAKEHEYFIEAKVKDLSLRSISNLRLLDSIAASFGMGFLIITILNYISLLVFSESLSYFALQAIIVFSPIFVGWLVPVLWILEDSQIREIDQEEGLIPNGYTQGFREGIAGKVLGIGGLIIGWTYLSQLAEEQDVTSTVEVLIFVSQRFINLLLLAAVSVLLVEIIFLSKYHESLVNTTRSILGTYLQFAITTIVIGESTVFCNKCGTKNLTISEYCSKCGSKLRADVLKEGLHE